CAADGSLNLLAVERQAAHLLANGISTVFVGGTTGESHSLSLSERLALAERGVQAARGSALRVIVHAGANCLVDARALAAPPHKHGASPTPAVPPSSLTPPTPHPLPP